MFLLTSITKVQKMREKKSCFKLGSSWTKQISEPISLEPSLVPKDLVKSLHHLIIPHTVNIVLDVLQAELRLQKQVDSLVGQQLLGAKDVRQEVCQDL